MDKITSFFGADGALAQSIEGYRPRNAQIEMALAVEQAIVTNSKTVIEAGTGTGKTFAYLVPAMMSAKKILVSTGTKHLQDQLFEKDLPRLKKLITHKPLTTALLKGRANYLCLYRIKTLRARGQFESKQQVNDFYAIEKFAGRTKSGDKTHFTDVPEHSSLWQQVTSTNENCLGAECPDYQECFLVKARKKAIEADIVVINHHLFCADLALKQEGFAEILPNAEVIIIDEAHQLAETAGRFFSEDIGTRQIVEFCHDLKHALAEEAKEESIILDLISALESELPKLRISLANNIERGNKMTIADAFAVEAFQAQVYVISDCIHAVLDRLNIISAQGILLTKLNKRLEETLQLWNKLSIDGINVNQTEQIIWVELYTHHLTFNATPVDISEQFQKHSNHIKAAWIFTSATLAIGDNFTYFCKPLGLFPDTTLQLASPFEYKKIALLYHPQGLPDPNHATYSDKMMQAMLPVIHASKGRTFLLFTSYKALDEATKFLQAHVDYPLFIQGNLPKLALIDAFRASGNGILLGTTSFWEGVCVKGHALTCVMIAKLPFASPADPIEQARIEVLNKEGGNSFMDYQLPKAVIALKQGIGRLIRDYNDYGVLVICDPRLTQKHYGKLFLNSLPDMTRTQKIERVEKFFQYMDQIHEIDTKIAAEIIE